MLLEQQGAGRDVVQRQRTDHHRRGARAGNTEGQHRHQCAAGFGTDGGFRGSEAAFVALAEFAAWAGNAFLGHVGHRTGQRCTCAGQYAHDETEYATTHVHPEHRSGFLEVEQHAPGRLEGFLATVGFFQQQQDFADGEQAQHQHYELNAVGEVDVIAGEAVHTAVGINADRRQKQPDQRGDEGLERAVAGHAAETDNRKHHQHEVFRRAEGNRPFRQYRREHHHPAGGNESADERTPGRQRQGNTGQALTGHRVAVEGRHHGGGFAGNVQQDRTDPAAVFATQIHRRQQDQCRLRRQAQCERNRDQQCHAVDRPQPRQQADDGADQRAAEGGHQVVRG
ncbi:hypothetical protein D9M71_246770 [compost metagenome]